MGAKLKAAAVLLLMFGLGVVSGIAWQMHSPRHGMRHGNHVERRIARLKKQLHLNAWQEQTLRDIIQDAHERAVDIREAMDFDIARVHDDTFDAIQQLLTPEQRAEFEKMHARWIAKHPPMDSNAPTADSEPASRSTS